MAEKERAKELADLVSETMKTLKQEAPEGCNVLDASMAIVFRAVNESQMPQMPDNLTATGAAAFMSSKTSFNENH